MKVPKILYKAQRHYRHNTGDDTLISGFDFEETIKIVNNLLERSDNSGYAVTPTATPKFPSFEDIMEECYDGTMDEDTIKQVYETIKKLGNFA